MGLRVRLALISSLVTLLALVALAVFSGFALERTRLRDIDEELVVQFVHKFFVGVRRFISDE